MGSGREEGTYKQQANYGATTRIKRLRGVKRKSIEPGVTWPQNWKQHEAISQIPSDPLAAFPPLLP
jgi:hypothetical protein